MKGLQESLVCSRTKAPSKRTSPSNRPQGCLEPEMSRALLSHSITSYVEWPNLSCAVRAPVKRKGCPITRLLQGAYGIRRETMSESNGIGENINAPVKFTFQYLTRITSFFPLQLGRKLG